jgi:iron(III) transport system substrate-binding protein
VVALLAVAALASCGGGDDSAEEGRAALESVLAAIDGLEGEARERKLVELAEAEGGELELYTSLTTAETALQEAFEDAYPINLSVYRARSETVARRVTEEARAGFRGADVVETGGAEMATLARDGHFATYRSPSLDALVEGSEQDGWSASRFVTFAVSWNTRRVAAGEEPRSFESLAEPRWQGRLALEADDADWYKTLRDHLVGYEGRSEADVDAMLEAIAANARVVSGHSLMSQLLGAGEFDVAVTSYLYLAKNSVDDGAPVAFEPFVEPVLTRPQGIGVLETARHPAAALLFVDWLLDEGQEVLAENNIEPSREDIADAPDAAIVPIDVESFVAEEDEWTDRYERLLAGSEQIEDDG